MMDNRSEEAIYYLKMNKSYKRIIGCIIDKYRSLGKLGGYIILKNLDEEEIRVLAPIDYKVYTSKECKISVQKFITNFCTGKFKDVDFLKVLEGYSHNTLITHKQKREEKKLRQTIFFEEVLQSIKNQMMKMWLEETISNRLQGYVLISGQYKGNEERLRDIFKTVDDTLQYLEQKQSLIPLVMVATEITQNPHYFDRDTLAFKILLYVLCYKQQVKYPEDIQEKNEVLYKERLLRDEISTSTICYGIEAYRENEKEPWELFWKKAEPMELMLYNLKGITRVQTKSKKVYIVENPAVFILLLETLKDLEVSLVCTRGQLNTADRLIIELLIKSGTKIYYNGDFDPEGLQIAQKIKLMHPDKVVMWEYNLDNYLGCKGTQSIEERLNKLESIYIEELQVIADSMKEEKVAAYQEMWVEKLANDIRINYINI
ncbi:MAG: TIGR02679 domain-containing protein [Cellulosilyticaceae bacterium]